MNVCVLTDLRTFGHFACSVSAEQQWRNTRKEKLDDLSPKRKIGHCVGEMLVGLEALDTCRAMALSLPSWTARWAWHTANEIHLGPVDVA